MPSLLSEREADVCQDILRNVEAAQDFVAGMSFETFEADLRTNYAVVRCLEIVSEASRRLGDTFKARHPDLPWRDIADAGNFYRHSYHRLALDIVWTTIHEQLPRLATVCRDELDPPVP